MFAKNVGSLFVCIRRGRLRNDFDGNLIKCKEDDVPGMAATHQRKSYGIE